MAKPKTSTNQASWVPKGFIDFANADIAFGSLEIIVIRAINASVDSLANDRLHKSHGCDTAFFGELVALAALAEADYPQGCFAAMQLEEWRQTYDDWFRRRRFRNAKAMFQQASVHELIDRLQHKASGGPRSTWVTDAWPGGWRPREGEATRDVQPDEDPGPQPRSPSFMEYEDGSHGLCMDTGSDTGYLWHAMIDYVARKEKLVGFDTLAFDPEAGMLVVRSPEKPVLQEIAAYIARIDGDEAIRTEAEENANDDLL